MNPETLSRLAITRDSVLLGHFDDIDHPKFFVIMGENSDQLVGFFFINTDIHDAVKRKQAQFEMQMHIRRSDYAFLKYDSFIGADRVKIISKDKVASDIINKTAQIKGSLTEDDLDRLLDAVRSSKLFSKIEKETFFQ